MLFNKLAYPEILIIAGIEYKCSRDMQKNEVKVPYSEVPDIGIGDVIYQKSGKREICLKVIDLSFLEGGSLGIGTTHPNILTMRVENTTSQAHAFSQTHSTSNFHIGSISGEAIQVGDNNIISKMTIQDLIEKVAQSEDVEAKSKLKKLLENSTVGSLIGASVTSLIGLL